MRVERGCAPVGVLVKLVCAGVVSLLAAHSFHILARLSVQTIAYRLQCKC